MDTESEHPLRIPDQHIFFYDGGIWREGKVLRSKLAEVFSAQYEREVRLVTIIRSSLQNDEQLGNNVVRRPDQVNITIDPNQDLGPIPENA